MGRWMEEQHSACKVFHDAFAWLELGATLQQAIKEGLNIMKEGKHWSISLAVCDD